MRSAALVSDSQLRGMLTRAQKNQGAKGLRLAYRDYGKNATLPADPLLRDKVLDLTEAVRLMGTLDRDVPRPEGEGVDWEDVMSDLRDLAPTHLTPAWYSLFAHPEQHRVWYDGKRFVIIPAGRRSGKTERAKRWLVYKALEFTAFPNGLFMACAPTNEQAVDIFWDDLKALVPRRFVVSINETKKIIRLINGARIRVCGLDKAQRIEGKPIDGIIVDEFADCKPTVWAKNIRPALSTIGRPGWAWIFGVPRPAKHYKEMFKKAQRGAEGFEDFGAYHWVSADIIPPEEVAAAKATLDPMTFLCEFEASFDTLANRVYYAFDPKVHLAKVVYDTKLPLIFCFDFNVDPGVAVIAQEQQHENPVTGEWHQVTAVIGEVWIPFGSSTPAVCRKLIEGWKHHKGPVYCYGDASGGARKTTQTEGNDWEQIRDYLRPVFPGLVIRIKKGNPAVKARTVAMNRRLMTADGKHHVLINPDKDRGERLVRDFEELQPLEGTAGEIDKRDKELTHISDAFSYYVDYQFPTQKRVVKMRHI